jgi:prepilin-type N-terminal cleavage/methylation domain-containing protein
MKNKGFTLTELLVVVVILGIITGISIPLIRGLSNTFEKKKYTNYADGVLSAAKLYNDSYSEDLFGHNEYGCAYITYEQLVEKNLLKDIGISDISCNSEKTYVRVIKQKDKYAYTSYLACGDKENGKVSTIKTSIPASIPNIDTDACTGVNPTNIVISATPENSPAFDKRRKSTKLTLTSYTGIDNNVVIYTKWSKDTNAGDNDNDWQKVSFKIAGNQEATLLNGEPITSTSKQLLTPDGGDEVDGSWILFVKVEQLQDLHGNKWKNTSNENSKVISFPQFNVDTIAPTITDFNVASRVSDYNGADVKVTFTGSDNHTSSSHLRMCITTSANDCKNASDYETYSSSKNITLSTSGDATKTIYVHLKDKTGNTTTKSKTYTLQGMVTVVDKYCNQNGNTNTCGTKVCDENGKNCTQIADKTRKIKGAYGSTQEVSAQSQTGYSAPSKYKVELKGSHTLTFYHTKHIPYENKGNGTNKPGYSYSNSNDSGINISYSDNSQLKVYPASDNGIGDGGATKDFDGSRFNYSIFTGGANQTYNGRWGTYFVTSNTASNKLELRPYIAVKYDVNGISSQEKVPLKSLKLASGPTKSGYTFRAWQVYSYERNGQLTKCTTEASGWKDNVYYTVSTDSERTIAGDAWNLSNWSYPCPLHYGYSGNYLTLMLKPVWQTNPWSKYE